jgi:hypothetical protein
MHEQEIKILQKQVTKLKSDDFDLEAWKAGSIIILERIFGPGNQKINQLQKIKYDQSSWALREASGSKNMMETCKKQGREILEIAMDELTLFGLPEEVAAEQAAPFKTVIVEALENELTIAQYREIIRIVDSDKQLTDKQKMLIETLHKYGHDVADNILSSILLSERTKKYL